MVKATGFDPVIEGSNPSIPAIIRYVAQFGSVLCSAKEQRGQWFKSIHIDQFKYRQKVFFMSKENYIKIMLLLDIVENELDKVAISVGHKTFKDWKKEREL